VNIKEDGEYGLETLGALESVFAIDEWTRTQQQPLATEFDERTEKNLATLDPMALDTMRKLVVIANQVATEEGLKVKVLSGHRTWKEQDSLYAQGKTLPGKKVTNAKGGFSNHNFGIAIDLGIFKGRTYLDESNRNEAVRIHTLIADRVKLEHLNPFWGGNWRTFKDYPHHEMRTNLTSAQKRAQYLDSGSVLV